MLEHAETVKKLSEQETDVHQLQLDQASHMASREEAYRSKVSKQASDCILLSKKPEHCNVATILEPMH